MRIIVIGDIHTQERKFWQMLEEAGIATAEKKATSSFVEDYSQLVILGDIVHAKSRDQYARLAGVERYDEYNPRHVEKVEREQETFLTDLKAFCDEVPDKVTILMGNHDFNALNTNQGPLRTDDVAHLEWREVTERKLPPDLQSWMQGWPFEHSIESIHFAHVGPLKEHNTYDNDFYLKNRRRWIYDDKDYLHGTAYQLGVYGHTPVRGGVNIASKGHAILLDTNGHGAEYVYLEINVHEKRYDLKMRGLFYDEVIQR